MSIVLTMFYAQSMISSKPKSPILHSMLDFRLSEIQVLDWFTFISVPTSNELFISMISLTARPYLLQQIAIWLYAVQILQIQIPFLYFRSLMVWATSNLHLLGHGQMSHIPWAMLLGLNLVLPMHIVTQWNEFFGTSDQLLILSLFMGELHLPLYWQHMRMPIMQRILMIENHSVVTLFFFMVVQSARDSRNKHVLLIVLHSIQSTCLVDSTK